MSLRKIMAAEGFVFYDIEMRIPYLDKEGFPIENTKWVLDLGRAGMFADKLDLRPHHRAALKAALKDRRAPYWKGPGHPKVDGKMVFRDVPEEAALALKAGASWYGIVGDITFTRK